MTALILIALVVAIIGYGCLAVKIGFWVGELTENTGFDAGFYMMTTCGILAIPFAIYAQVCL